MNRAQRRAQRKKPPQTLGDYLELSDMVVRRGELWDVIFKAIRIHELDKMQRTLRWRIAPPPVRRWWAERRARVEVADE